MAAAGQESSDWSSGKLVVPVVAALLGFISGYLLEIVKSRRGPKTLLAWDLKVEQPELSYGAKQADQVKISYRGREVDRLVNVRYTITNAGNTSIKNQSVRFGLPKDAKILERELDPIPEPELGVRDITDEDPAFTGPRYKIGQLDPGDAVAFVFAADGGTWHGWKGAKLHNEETDVVYQRRDVALQRDDQTHVGPFLFGLAAILIVTTLTGAASLAIWILSKFYLVDLAYFGIIILLTVTFAAAAVYLLSHARRATRSIAERWATLGHGAVSLTAGGGNSWFAYAPNGEIRVEPPTSDTGKDSSA